MWGGRQARQELSSLVCLPDGLVQCLVDSGESEEDLPSRLPDVERVSFSVQIERRWIAVGFEGTTGRSSSVMVLL